MSEKEKIEYPLSTYRHSLAHILAQAIQKTLDIDAQLGIGPAIDNGFYYDFVFSDGIEITGEALKSLTKTMQNIVKQGQSFRLYESTVAESHQILDFFGQEFKKDLLEKFSGQGETKITYYLNTIKTQAVQHLLSDATPGYKDRYQKVTEFFQSKIPDLADEFVTFVDMCEGPHVANTKEIPDAFVLDKIAGAYRRGDADNAMMTRIYWLAYETKEELKAYQDMMEEAKKRDHRILGQRLKLFTISPLVGSGLPLMQPKGMVIRKAIEDYLREMHADKGYDRVRTPHLAKEELYITSGHAEKFGDELFRVQGADEKFFMKPMNCPHHMQIFADNQFSYRDMPIRYFEPATVYRDEKTGQLSGLTRVRAITQDDGHLFCRVGQISEEVGTIVDIIKQFYTTMGMIEGYRVRLSVRGPEGKYLGSDEVWEQAEGALRDASEKYELPYRIGIDEAAFYGPKLDFMFKDAIGREWQLATIQCDFNLPVRFDLSYVNEQGEKERPVVIHRAISGSLERFMGVMIEHFGGAFPVWLAPRQVTVIPVADVFNDYAQEVKTILKKQGIRADVDEWDDSFNKKIRNAEQDRVPYMLIVGEKEKDSKGVSVRELLSKKQYEMSVDEFCNQIVTEKNERRLLKGE